VASRRTQPIRLMLPSSGCHRLVPPLGATRDGVTWEVTALPGPLTQLVVVSGQGQAGTAGQPLGAALTVRTADRYGNGIANQSVTWAVASGDGTLGATTTVSNEAGETSTTWTLGSAAGTQTVTATAGAVSVTFTATAAP
jgi:hypothetical protein